MTRKTAVEEVLRAITADADELAAVAMRHAERLDKAEMRGQISLLTLQSLP
jgi:hypothetical protein